jgi:hypothetical protein
MVAQRGNLDAVFFRHLQDVLALFSLDGFAVKFKGNHRKSSLNGYHQRSIHIPDLVEK